MTAEKNIRRWTLNVRPLPPPVRAAASHKVSFWASRTNINIIYNETINWIKMELWSSGQFVCLFFCVCCWTRNHFLFEKYHCHPCFQSGEQQFFHYADGLCWIALQKMSHNKIIKHMFGSNLPASKLDLDVRKKVFKKKGLGLVMALV